MKQLTIIGARVLGLCLFVCPMPLIAQTTERISVDSYGIQGNGDVYGWATFSADGRFVAFASDASNLVPGDTNNVSDVFVRDRIARTTERISIDSNGNQANGPSYSPDMSADGRFLVFTSQSSTLVPGHGAGIYIHDRVEQTTEWIASSYGAGIRASISADGQFVVFYRSSLPAFMAVYDRVHQTYNEIGDGYAILSDISADGRYVAYYRSGQIRVLDRLNNSTEIISKNNSGELANGLSSHPRISEDGRFVTYMSLATNLAPEGNDPGSGWDVFVFDRSTDTTELVSTDTDGVSGDDASEYPDISADGRFITFQSHALNLGPDPQNGRLHVYVRDMVTQTTELRSVNSLGEPSTRGCFLPTISADGRYTAYYSWDGNLVPGDSNGVMDFFVYDREGIGDPEQLLAFLTEQIQTINLRSGISNSLDSKLQAAASALGDINENNDVAACDSLGAFIIAVDAQSGKQISTEDALELVGSAENILFLLDCR